MRVIRLTEKEQREMRRLQVEHHNAGEVARLSLRKFEEVGEQLLAQKKNLANMYGLVDRFRIDISDDGEYLVGEAQEDHEPDVKQE